MNIFYLLAQCTWGIAQTLLGGINFLLNIKAKHYIYHSAIYTEWEAVSSVSLGLFVFISANDKTETEGDIVPKESVRVHEYGHTIQSLILGPLYLIVIGIPSSLWWFLPPCKKLRREKNISYFSFYTESWANKLGEAVIKEKIIMKRPKK